MISCSFGDSFSRVPCGAADAFLSVISVQVLTSFLSHLVFVRKDECVQGAGEKKQSFPSDVHRKKKKKKAANEEKGGKKFDSHIAKWEKGVFRLLSTASLSFVRLPLSFPRS